MKAAFLVKPGVVSVEDVTVPECACDQVLINIKEIGICGSDLHYFYEGRIGDHIVTKPHILGHEASGVVVKLGRDVKGIAVGDRVCIEPGLPCLSCDYCKEGRYNLCDSICFSGAPPYQGMLCEFFAHDSRFVYKIPDSVSFTQAALAEPLAVAHNAVRKVRLVPGETILVIGTGPIGFSCIQMARVGGAAKVIAVERLAFRRKVAEKIGADIAMDPSSGDVIERLAEVTRGRMCDCVIEASGSKEAIEESTQYARKGGRIAFVGMGSELVSLRHSAVLKKELLISGVYRYANNFRPVVELLSAGKIDAKSWVSHRFPLERTMDAIMTAGSPSLDKTKVMVNTSGAQ